MKKILFICLGNICRSSAAEGVFLKLLKEQEILSEYEVDSAGLIDYHQGELSDPRMRKHAYDRGINLTHRSRPVTKADMGYYDHIFAMDKQNISGLSRISPENMHKVELLATYCKNHSTDTVPDPYYGGAKDFEYVLDLLEDACNELITKLHK